MNTILMQTKFITLLDNKCHGVSYILKKRMRFNKNIYFTDLSKFQLNEILSENCIYLPDINKPKQLCLIILEI